MSDETRAPGDGETDDTAGGNETVESNPDTSATTDDDGMPVDNPSG
ncbi:hypothetical protein [Microbacterium sp. SLBN-146]|nr:hypothetical protein [Microbacterium sp. SLBN-146]TQJ31519.1 hypothetical protein FBY39_1996 [Microbacterium sp. SLBN-146]